MKTILFLSLALAVGLSACKTEPTPEVKPTPTPVIVVPTPTPVATPPPFVAGEHCSKEGKQFYCGNPVWYGYAKCSNVAGEDGSIYFKDYQSIVDMMAAKDRGLCLDVVFKDGKKQRVPNPFGAPGPCATCVEM